MNGSQELLGRLSHHHVFGEFAFEAVDLGGIEAVVTRLIPPDRAVELWRAACELETADFSAILTDDDHVHEDVVTMTPLAPLSLDEARAAREALVRSSADTSAILDAIPDALPDPDDYEERDVFLGLDPDAASISLLFARADSIEIVRPFSPDGEGRTPRHAELVPMLRHLQATYGARPLYAEGNFIELDVQTPPCDVVRLRALARDFFLLSQGTGEGFGFEDPARLLRRLMSTRWLVWWYGTM